MRLLGDASVTVRTDLVRSIYHQPGGTWGQKGQARVVTDLSLSLRGAGHHSSQRSPQLQSRKSERLFACY